jgi:NADPH:quinone reductase-like Zn-dependent oxidoreductase
MKAARIHQFGSPNVIVIDQLPRPTPGNGEVLVRVKSAGVGPWDALIRERKAVVSVSLPLILGSDLAGVIEEVGAGVSEFKKGDAVYGSTNADFCGAYTEYAIASAALIAQKPQVLSYAETASVPVVAVTAWQMLFEYAAAKAGQNVLIHGAAGNVGAYAVQLASKAGLEVVATAAARDVDYVHDLGADRVLEYRSSKFEDEVSDVDIVLDMVGGETLACSLKVVKSDGIVVSAVSPVPDSLKNKEVRTVFFLVEVTTKRLNLLTELFEQHKLRTDVGTVLPLEQVQTAHQMLAGTPHKRGKIVLEMGTGVSE